MEPTIMGPWSKRQCGVAAMSSGDEAPRPRKRSKHNVSVVEHDSSGLEEDEHDKKKTSDLLSIRDVIEELQSNEREFHRFQQVRYESLKRTIIDMETRWTKEKYKRKIAKLEEKLSRQKQQKEDPVMSLKSQDQDVARWKASTPVVSREAVSSLPTPSKTVGRLAISSVRAEAAQQEPAAGHIEQEEDNPSRLSVEQKGKWSIQPSSPTTPFGEKNIVTGLPAQFEPVIREPSIGRARRSRTPMPMVNSSDGDDEDDNPEDMPPLQNDSAQRSGISSHDVALDWPVGVGIGAESIEVDIPDHISASDISFSSPDPVLSPLLECVEDTVPVCPGPFKLTPQLGSPASLQVRSLRKRTNINYQERLRLGLSDDDMDLLTPPKGRRGVKAEFRESDDDSYQPESIISVSTNKSSNKARSVINFKKDHIAPGQKPFDCIAKDPRRQDAGGGQQQLICRGRLLPLSDDDEDQPRDVDRAPPPTKKPQSLVRQFGGFSTQESIQALGAPPPALNVPDPMARFSRDHIQKALGGKPRCTVTIAKQSFDKVSPIDQFLCINGDLNPYSPSRPGMHGAIFIFRTGTVPLNTEWAVFCSRPRAGAMSQENFEYVGHYVVKDVNDLSHDEWMSSGGKFREGWVNHISREAKALKGRTRLDLVNRGLIRITEQILPEQVRGWLNASAETYPSLLHARLGRRVLEFREYKRGLYDLLVKAKQQVDEKKLER